MSIVLENLTKRYGSHCVVNNVSLEVHDGELFVLLGASGSGKSTILRLIAGLSLCDSGRILLHGRDVTHLAPQPRGTGFVFQNYSIFRHMTVGENVEFGLKIRKVPAGDRARRREELLDLVGLSGLGDRYADQISGGQQQRVALARALAYEPAVLLLDEPLGALDVKIRTQLRRSLKEVQRRLQITTILVTHDQEEAFELGDRIGIVERGVLLEVGEPETLYARPQTQFVATFLGAGTILAGRVRDGRARFGSISLPIPADAPHEETAHIELLIRPEQVGLTSEAPNGNQVNLGKGTIVEQVFIGAQRRLRLRLPQIPGTRQISPVPPFGEPGLLIDVLVPTDGIPKDRELWVTLRGWTILQQAPPRLLAIATGKGSVHTLEATRLLAESMGASVSVLGWVADETRDSKETFEQLVRDAGLPPETDVQLRSGKLSDLIQVHRAGILFDAVLLPRPVDPHGRIREGIILSVLESADVPVLVVGEAPRPVRRILICTRGGEPGKRDIRFGGRLARHMGATVTLLHVAPASHQPPARIKAHLEKAAASLAGMEVKHEIRLRNGEVVEEILRENQEHDLLVIGGHGPPARTFFREHDVTMQLVEGTRNPVLIIPSEE